MNSIIQKDLTKCYVCGTTINIHIHHVFEGRNRKNSDKDGCIVALCGRHHNLSNEGVHFNKKLDDDLKKICEYKWLEYYDKEIKDFIKKYGRNYL